MPFCLARFVEAERNASFRIGEPVSANATSDARQFLAFLIRHTHLASLSLLMNLLKTSKFWMVLAAVASLVGCASSQQRNTLETVDHVDLDRFMGEWYVVAHTPTTLDRNAFNGTHTYTWRGDGRIDAFYRFNNGDFEAKERTFNAVASVKNARTNAQWDMKLMWPVHADYRIIYLDEGYQTVIIGHPNRRHTWILRREPQMGRTDYADAILFLQRDGFDVSRIRLMPHRR